MLPFINVKFNSQQHAVREPLMAAVSVKVMAKTFLMNSDSHLAKEFAALIAVTPLPLNYEKLAITY